MNRHRTTVRRRQTLNHQRVEPRTVVHRAPAPLARAPDTKIYPDAIGRNQATAEYGTNGDAPFTRSDTIPASSATVLVTLTLFNDRGEPYQSVDPMGTVTQITLDDAGRRVELINNFQSGAPSSGDVNVTVQWTFTADDLEATVTALNSATGDQVTTSNYGTTLADSDVARNDVLSSTVYADGGTVSYLVNRQSERKQLTDQNGTVHAYGLDLLAREVSDSITTLGTGVDGTILCIGRTYDVRGMLEHVTSYSDAAGTTVVNDVLRVYNSFEQCIDEYQEHSGAVNTSTSVVVGYEYADGSANTVRQTAIVYPNGRTITLDYGASGGIDDSLSRVVNLIDDDDTTLVSYTRIGAATFVQQSSPQPQIAWSLINGTGIDPYSGLDQFNRTVDNRWYSTATNADLDRIQHGYDLASNRLWRKNTVADAAGVYLDELYAVDGLYRLVRLDRGQLNSTNDGIVSGTEDFTQAWELDATGNWSTFNQADTGGSWTLEQTRTANAVNEITAISGGGWAEPAYDAAGNMTTLPQPAAPTNSYAGVYDAWNRLMSLWAGGSPVAANLYDGLNRRTSETASRTTRDFYYSFDWQTLEERVGGSPSADRQFVWGLRYIDDLLLRDCSDFTPSRLYAFQDPNWNVTSIVDSTGTVQERYDYSAYGKPGYFDAGFVGIETSAFGWETLFAGYRFDAESALFLARKRFYNPALGCWLSRDPIERDDIVNAYLYVNASPVQNVDPTGEFLCALVLVGAVLVLVCGCSTQPKPQQCVNPCGDAKKQGLDSGDVGGVVCCNGMKYTCVWGTGSATGAKDKDAIKIIQKCTAKHEDTHHDDIDCPQNKAGTVTRPNFKPGKNAQKEECLAYKAEAQCYKNNIGSCGKNKACVQQVQAEWNYVKPLAVGC